LRSPAYDAESGPPQPSYAGNDDDSDTSPTTTASRPANTTTKPAVASAAPQSTIITIKNDLSEDQNNKYGHVKLAFNGGPRATTTLQRGKTLEIDCKDVKAVHAGVEQNTSWGKLLFKTEGQCGKTINLSSVW
jgi:hypothetical protein